MPPCRPLAHPSIQRYQIVGRSRRDFTFIVVGEPVGSASLLCDGRPVTTADPVPCGEVPARAEHGATVSPGDILVDDASGLRLVCTRGGEGRLTYGNRVLRPIVTKI